MGRQWLVRYGKTDNGVVTVTTAWADERVYYPVEAVPYIPARHFAEGKSNTAFRTKLQIGTELQALISSATAGRGLHLYIPNQQTTVNCRWSW